MAAKGLPGEGKAMSDDRKEQDGSEEATTFFNRGRRKCAEIVRDNEQLRSKIRRLEQALRGPTDPVRRKPREGSADEY